MHSPRKHLRWCVIALFAMLSRSTADEPYTPRIEAASEEGQRRIAAFRPASNVSVTLFAAEPMVANPVAFTFDEKGRLFLIETFRHHKGVSDTRGHMNWLDADLSCRTVADRVAMYKKYLGMEEFARWGVEHDRIRLIEDRDGDGKADHSAVFADGFKSPETGLAAGVLARKGDVYFACIPDLWMLRDKDGDGKADTRVSLHSGYGVHVGFLGHDLHGLRFGPDGRLYFTIGDRGMNVSTIDGKSLDAPDSGAVLRCDPDGSNLEIVHSGLRNPQELAFNEFGDLFTVDNNCDSGDKARLVQVVEGGDSGWRIGYQFLEKPGPRGAWNGEKLWHLAGSNTASYLLPPLAHITDGPSGLTYHPGTSLLPERFKGHFFVADFRGTAGQSGVRAFRVRPKGGSFELVHSEQFLWGLAATDCEFGPDGAFYVSDWVDGWDQTGKGRIYRLADPDRAAEQSVAETRDLISNRMDARSDEELIKLFAHADQRVRLEAQFALVERIRKVAGDRPLTNVREFNALLLPALGETAPRLARIHAIWALGQLVARSKSAPGQLPWEQSVATLLKDSDDEIRAQVLRTLTARTLTPAATLPLLRDSSPRVRFFGLMAFRDAATDEHIEPVLETLRGADGHDPYLRHAAVMALSASGVHEKTLRPHIHDPSREVRLALVLVARRRGFEYLAELLEDGDAQVALEAARAAYGDRGVDRPALKKLAALASKTKLADSVWRRVIAANNRLGREENASILAAIAARSDVPDRVRVEALEVLSEWPKPPIRDRISGLANPIADRSPDFASAALALRISALLGESRDSIREAAAHAAGTLAVREATAGLIALVDDNAVHSRTRVEAIKALESLKSDQLAAVVKKAVKGKDNAVRGESLRILAELDPASAIPELKLALKSQSLTERQGAFAALAKTAGPEADAIFAEWLDRLAKNDVPADVQLDLLEAAAQRNAGAIKAKLEQLASKRPASDAVASFRPALQGGDFERGRRIFREKVEVYCTRCHKVRGEGGEVGPDLTQIGGKQTREYLLAALVAPNEKIAEGFETVVVAKADGQIVAGVLKGENEREIRLITPEAKLVVIPKNEVDERKRGDSAMPADLVKKLSKFEIRDLIEFLARLR